MGVSFLLLQHRHRRLSRKGFDRLPDVHCLLWFFNLSLAFDRKSCKRSRFRTKFSLAGAGCSVRNRRGASNASTRELTASAKCRGTRRSRHPPDAFRVRTPRYLLPASGAHPATLPSLNPRDYHETEATRSFVRPKTEEAFLRRSVHSRSEGSASANIRAEASRRCTFSHEGVSEVFFNPRCYGPANFPKLNSMGVWMGGAQSPQRSPICQDR